MLVFSTPLVSCYLSTFSLTSHTPPPLPKVNVQYIQTVCGGGGGGVLSCVVEHILQEFNTLFLTRFRTYKIATLPKKKRPVWRHLGIGVFKIPSSMVRTVCTWQGLSHEIQTEITEYLPRTPTAELIGCMAWYKYRVMNQLEGPLS